MEKVLSSMIAGYIMLGLFVTLFVMVWAWRKTGKETQALLFVEGGIMGFAIFLLWPLWVWMTVMETGWAVEEQEKTDSGSPEQNANKPSVSGLPAVGTHGITLTPMRPSGTVKVGGEEVDAISKGAFLEAGVPVDIVGHSMNTVEVRKRREPSPESEEVASR